MDNHRVHTKWQLSISVVHSIMIENSDLAGEGGGGGARPSPFFLSTIMYKVACVCSSWEGKYTPYFISISICSLCDHSIPHLVVKTTENKIYRFRCCTLYAGPSPWLNSDSAFFPYHFSPSHHRVKSAHSGHWRYQVWWGDDNLSCIFLKWLLPENEIQYSIAALFTSKYCLFQIFLDVWIRTLKAVAGSILLLNQILVMTHESGSGYYGFSHLCP
jgi:hypothetical protein